MATKKERTAQAVAQAVGAGRAVALETVDFSDPNRPKTCLEVDFPILPVNQVAIIEGNAGKPIYQMSKWWARRRSSVFRSLLIAAAAKAPDDSTEAAKRVWDAYYANHQTKGAFQHLKVADIFMGGGTTLVEGSRLGMQMIGNDLNPVAWFVVKQEFAQVDQDEVKRLLAEIEAEVRPQIMPFYACDGPDGERGTWTHLPSGRVEGPEFDPLTLTPEQRREYRYEGSEIIYTFWAKHGPCQVTGCGHRTPIMTSPVMAVKTISVKHWERRCGQCGAGFHVEEKAARMAPEVPLVVTPGEAAYSILDLKRGVVCPACGHAEMVQLGKGKNKKVSLTLLVHPEWLAGAPGVDDEGQAFGGSAQDDAGSTARWDQARAARMRLLEVRGELPAEVTPWVSVLESLFDAGFALIATYPIRSDETKGDKAAFGAQKIEYDIIHVCRKRQDAPKRISWAKLRRQVLSDVRALQNLLEHHQNEGLPEADVQVIRRGKALEYFSRHYGEVYKDPDTPMTVLEALLGINQLLDEEAGGVKEAPPGNAEPFTRMVLRLFDEKSQLPRDQLQKFLRGTGSAPSDFVERGWVSEHKKIFSLTPPLELAQSWSNKHRKGLQSDYDQAMFLIGACIEGSGIHVNDTLNNPHFRPHPALEALLIWFKTHGAERTTRTERRGAGVPGLRPRRRRPDPVAAERAQPPAHEPGQRVLRLEAPPLRPRRLALWAAAVRRGRERGRTPARYRCAQCRYRRQALDRAASSAHELRHPA